MIVYNNTVNTDITLIEAAHELGIKPDILRIYAYRGKIGYYKRGSMLFVTRKDLDEYKINRANKKLLQL